MAWTEWVQTDDYQWQRKNGRYGSEYEMYEAVFHPEPRKWFVGGGTFSIYDWPLEYREFAASIRGTRLDGMRTDVLAEWLFEDNFADWDLECFDTEDEAVAYLDKLMKEG